MTARIWTRIAGAAVAACVAILLADFAVATWQAPRDEKLVKSLQQEKRITDARRARKSRDNAVAWMLIAAASLFLTFAKRVVHTARPARKEVGRAHRPALGSQPRSLVRAAPALDLAFIDGLVATHGPSSEKAIILLQAIQNHYGYLPDEAMRRLSEMTDITPAQLAGTSSFYGQFRRTPVGKHLVRVCHGTACHVAGARQITDELRRHLDIPEGADTDAARMFTVGEVACLGCCSLAPVLIADGHTAGRLTPSSAIAEVAQVEATETA
ncbi:MAG TPA: NAD(P)H-dependent oxidoreductase subunit E [Bryobacteraceae bacterium]|nr:NAD(P)H-dependent oxidoreductase subunit E [Bryobacteraceae bacterium]